VRAAAAEEVDIEPGALEAAGGALRLGCANGVLCIQVVQPSGRVPMAAEAYLRGHPVPSLAG
jgi:methionyl-tRNA formyltransferase